MTPYRIKSQSVSVRLRRGTSAGGLAVELIHDLKTKPHYPADNGVRGRLTRGSQLDPAAVHKIPLEFYTEGIFCQRKNIALKRFLPSFGKTQECGGIRGVRANDHDPQIASSTLVLSYLPWLCPSQPRPDRRREDGPKTARPSRLCAPAGDSRRRSRHEPFRQPGHFRGSRKGLDYFRQHPCPLPVVSRRGAFGATASQRRSRHPPGVNQ